MRIPGEKNFTVVYFDIKMRMRFTTTVYCYGFVHSFHFHPARWQGVKSEEWCKHSFAGIPVW